MAIIDLQRQAGVLGGFAGSGGGGGGAASDVASYFVRENSTVLTVTAGDWLSLNFGSSGALAVGNSGFSIVTNATAQLRYDGSSTFVGVVSAVLTGIPASGTQDIDFRLIVNGGGTPENIITVVRFVSPGSTQMVLEYPITLEPTNTFRIQMRNPANSVNMTYRTFTLRAELAARLAASTFSPSVFQAGAVFAADSDTGVLGFKAVYGCVDTSAPRTLTLNSADIALGSPTAPWVFSVSDQSGGAGANAITIDTEGGELIAGASSIQITEDFGSVTLYADGSNVFVRA